MVNAANMICEKVGAQVPFFVERDLDWMGVCVLGAGRPVHLLYSMNLRADVCGFVSRACQPSEHNRAMVSMLNRWFDG